MVWIIVVWSVLRVEAERVYRFIPCVYGTNLKSGDKEVEEMTATVTVSWPCAHW